MGSLVLAVLQAKAGAQAESFAAAPRSYRSTVAAISCLVLLRTTLRGIDDGRRRARVFGGERVRRAKLKPSRGREFGRSPSKAPRVLIASVALGCVDFL